MSNANVIQAPVRREKITLRISILLGMLSIIYFSYWFLNMDFIQNQFLFWILVISLLYDFLKISYLWYHYWDISIPEKPNSSAIFKVDVFTTYFPGEPYEMVKGTLLAIQKIKHPHTTFLCDEANDRHLKEFCQENNIIHVTRNNRINAKAGNINNALLQAKGDLCLILDPDHIPFDNFLDEVVPYFEDETIGFVQTVQAYYNIKESAVAKGAAEQTFHFYGPVMMTMNSYGSVNAIGANCVFRRKALDSIGGHAPGLSEDMHTSMRLHAKGWRSVYVPKVLAKGLSPASLTAYYKQQLKWSRGTLELLVAVYPRLFKKFSLRQKIHYGILPFHYLSGINYLINFLIPIISLFSASTPWKGNILDFGLIISPVFICAIGIRFYVQKWVMYKSERGLHITGGLLQICTWWINIIGLFYTVIRKKVPYLPTPKEDKDLTNWKILIPNMIIGIVSIAAVIYGLSIDFTPFSIFMSFFALLNAGIMFYTLFFAFQRQKPVSLKSSLADLKIPLINRIQNLGFEFRRKAALPVIITALITSLFIQNNIDFKKWGGVTPEVSRKNIINYLGIFAPKIDNGISDLRSVKEISKRIGANFDIISIYIPWEKYIESNFPQLVLDSIYDQKSIPMITWEPWINFIQKDNSGGKQVFELIEEGYFDSYIAKFAVKLKNLQRPVFLRFAHEFDNPFYPWFVDGSESSIKFKKAWIHTYEIFQNNGAVNAIWIWNPWKSNNIESFYPGPEYVDWIGVDILNYGKLNQDGKSHDFDELYKPFHEEFSKLPSTPVIISEFGTLNADHLQGEWFSNAFTSITDDFQEIKSVVYFNNKTDNNWPKDSHISENLDWSLHSSQISKNSFIGKEVPDYVLSKLPYLKTNDTTLLHLKTSDLKNFKGVNLKKGHDWRKDYNVLSRANLLIDFEKMKRLSVNTIKFEWNSIYRYNILNITKEANLNVYYGFWIPEDLDFVNDTIGVNQLKQNVLEEISKRKHYSNIVSWNIQNDVLYNQKNYYHKPELLFQNRAYILWLKNLISEIKKLDTERPVIVDLEVNNQSIQYSKMLIDNVTDIDCIGLVVKDDKNLQSLEVHLKRSNVEFIFSEISTVFLTKPEIFDAKTSFFITAWQDQHESNKLSFDGLIDWKGRYKVDYFNLQNKLLGYGINVEPPQIRILKPAILTYANRKVEYYAMLYDDKEGWKFGWQTKGLSFEWSLVKCDKYGNYLAIKDIGFGSKISLIIPDDQELYRLLLTAYYGDATTTTITKLNTPLVQKSNYIK
jgi:cellulose synthase (UDP-forming)